VIEKIHLANGLVALGRGNKSLHQILDVNHDGVFGQDADLGLQTLLDGGKNLADILLALAVYG